MKALRSEATDTVGGASDDPFGQVPLDLYELIPGFLKRREKEIGELRGFVATSDFTSISGVGHKLKGTGTGYGLQTFTDLGCELERASQAQDVEKVRSLVDQFESLTRTLNERWNSRGKA